MSSSESRTAPDDPAPAAAPASGETAGEPVAPAVPAAAAEAPASEAAAETSSEASATQPRRWPSDDFEELADQLDRQLERLEAAGADETAGPETTAETLRLVQGYLLHAQVLAWRRVGRGDLAAPRALLDELLVARSFLDRHLPEMTPVTRAATELFAALHSLYTACEALEELQTEARLADRERSATERAVLKVLAENRDRYLRRGEVYDRLDPESRPSVARVGQVLAGLHDDGLLVRLRSSAQGNPETSFYALSGRGREVWRAIVESEETAADRSPTAEEEAAERQFRQLIAIAVNPYRSKDERRVVTGIFARSYLHGPRDVPLKALLAEYVDRLGTPAEPLVESLCEQVFLSAAAAAEGESEVGSELCFPPSRDRWPLLAEQAVARATRGSTLAPPASGRVVVRGARRPRERSFGRVAGAESETPIAADEPRGAVTTLYHLAVRKQEMETVT